MERKEIEETVYRMMQTLSEEKSFKDLTPMTHLNEFLDSLDVVEAFMQIERIYNISIKDKDIVACRTIDDFINTVVSAIH